MKLNKPSLSVHKDIKTSLIPFFTKFPFLLKELGRNQFGVFIITATLRSSASNNPFAINESPFSAFSNCNGNCYQKKKKEEEILIEEDSNTSMLLNQENSLFISKWSVETPNSQEQFHGR